MIMHMGNINFVIFTRNEEKRIGYVIRNLIKYGEVIVFDDLSGDKTQEIVEGLGAKFITRPGKIAAEDERTYLFVRQYVKNGMMELIWLVICPFTNEFRV